MATKKKIENTEKESQEVPKPRLTRRSDFHHTYVDNFRISYSDVDIKITTAISELLGDGTELFTETGVLIMSPITATRLLGSLTEALKGWEVAEALEKE